MDLHLHVVCRDTLHFPLVLLLHTNCKHQAFRRACSEKVDCANAFRMGSSDSSLIATSWACASFSFLTEKGAKVENYWQLSLSFISKTAVLSLRYICSELRWRFAKRNKNLYVKCPFSFCKILTKNWNTSTYFSKKKTNITFRNISFNGSPVFMCARTERHAQADGPIFATLTF